MRRRATISTPHPTAEAVAEDLAVPKRRALRLIRLMDSIITGEKVLCRPRAAC